MPQCQPQRTCFATADDLLFSSSMSQGSWRSRDQSLQIVRLTRRTGLRAGARGPAPPSSLYSLSAAAQGRGSEQGACLLKSLAVCRPLSSSLRSRLATLSFHSKIVPRTRVLHKVLGKGPAVGLASPCSGSDSSPGLSADGLGQATEGLQASGSPSAQLHTTS